MQSLSLEAGASEVPRLPAHYPPEAASLLELLHPVLDPQILEKALVQIHKLVERSSPAHALRSNVSCLSDLPPECLVEVLDRADLEARRSCAAACTSTRDVISAARAAQRWREGLWCVTSTGVHGSELSLEHYSQVRRKWSLLGSVPVNRAGAAGACVQYEGKTQLVVTGGSAIRKNKVVACSDSVQRYEVDSRSWSDQPRLTSRRIGHAMAQVGSSLFVVGGVGKNRDYLNSVEEARLGSGPLVWQESVAMQHRRSLCAVACSDGLMFVCGGLGPDGPLSSVEVYNPTTAEWSSLPDLIHPHSGAAAAVCGDLLVVCGGAERFTEAYNFSTATWCEMSSLQMPRAHCGALFLQDELYLIGGVATRLKPGNQVSTELVAVGAAKFNQASGWVALPQWGKFGEIVLFGSGGLLPMTSRQSNRRRKP